eukprot:14071773-Alexandrium_andersonii.AAC.1
MEQRRAREATAPRARAGNCRKRGFPSVATLVASVGRSHKRAHGRVLVDFGLNVVVCDPPAGRRRGLSLIHISEPTRLALI